MGIAGRTAGRLTLSIAILVLLGAPSGAEAQNASALVLEKTGATVNSLSAMIQQPAMLVPETVL